MRPTRRRSRESSKPPKKSRKPQKIKKTQKFWHLLIVLDPSEKVDGLQTGLWGISVPYIYLHLPTTTSFTTSFTKQHGIY